MSVDALIEASRPKFEAYFLASRRSKGADRQPSLKRFPDGTYVSNHTQRHWWTYQQAIKDTTPQGCQA